MTRIACSGRPWLGLFLGLLVAAPAAGDTVFRLELSLTDAAAVDAAIAAHGGRRSGGTFGADGWTTTSRDDYLEINLEKAERTIHRTMDLTATSPAGTLYEDRLILAINNCGGSSQVICGSWDEAANRGGPLGVTYSNVVLEIYGTPDPDAGDGGDDDPEVLGPDDGGGADGDSGFDRGFPDDGFLPDTDPGSDGGGEALDARPDGGVPVADEDGGCGCRSAGARGRAGGAPLLLLGLFVAGRSRFRRRR